MSGDTVVRLGFLKDKELYKREKPYILFVGNSKNEEGVPKSNVELQTVEDIPVTDVRDSCEAYTLDKHGFQFITHQQTFSDFEDDNLIKGQYLPQAEKVIMDNIPYAKRILIFDWRRRKQLSSDEAGEHVSAAQLVERSITLAPSQTVHSDTTEFSLLKRVRREFPEEADDLLKGRIQMINFWRPIYHTVWNWPLVVCDGRTAQLSNLRAVDQVTRKFIGDIYYAIYDSTLRWYYMGAMCPSEGVLFKSWDTSGDAPAKTCLHSSSALPPPILPESYHPRYSIEVRALVFS